MFVQNDINAFDMMCDSWVNHRTLMIELPDYCTVENGEKFVVIAHNEGSAYIVPLESVRDKIAKMKDAMSSQTDEKKRLTEETLEDLYSSMICQVEASKMEDSDTSSKPKYGICAEQFRHFLDKTDADGVQSVVFQNINGTILMHYGYESYKNNIAKEANRRCI